MFFSIFAVVNYLLGARQQPIKKTTMARRKSNTGIPGLSFSWKRALGITQAKQRLARETGIPMSRAGVERKIGSMILKALFGKK